MIYGQGANRQDREMSGFMAQGTDPVLQEMRDRKTIAGDDYGLQWGPPNRPP